MRRFILYILLISTIHVAAQDLNSMALKRKFNSREELIKSNPSLTAFSLRRETQSIKITDENNIIKNQVTLTSELAKLNSFIFSPDQSTFVAYDEVESETEELYFCQSNGTILSRQKVHLYPNLKFSLNGRYVIVYNNFGRQVLVFDNKGNLLFSGDYIDLINDKSKVLNNVFVSEDGRDVLINAGITVYVFDMRTKAKKFQSEIGGWALAGNSSNGTLALKIKKHTADAESLDLEMISREDGKTLDHLSGLKKIDFTKTGVIIISKDSNILEYVFKK